ncbi:MAG: hypothetical protein WC526_02455 [Patescibacteria group bacterium]
MQEDTQIEDDLDRLSKKHTRLLFELEKIIKEGNGLRLEMQKLIDKKKREMVSKKIDTFN